MPDIRSILLAAMLAGGCATVAPSPPAGTIAGNWRAAGGMDLAISRFSSFAVRRGCIISGGMLRPLGDGRFRIDRYETGFASEECGPWRNGAAIAPFDSAEIRLERSGPNLVARDRRHRIVLNWRGAGTV